MDVALLTGLKTGVVVFGGRTLAPATSRFDGLSKAVRIGPKSTVE